MNFQYKLINMELEVFVGKLIKEVILREEVNKLYWFDEKENFFDMEKYARRRKYRPYDRTSENE